jgi:putative transcriptional regulator
MMSGMIKSRVREVAEAHGIASSYALQHTLGVAPTVAARLWQDKVTRFSVETLNKLCEAFNCQPGDLLIHIPDKKKGRK